MAPCTPRVIVVEGSGGNALHQARRREARAWVRSARRSARRTVTSWSQRAPRRAEPGPRSRHAVASEMARPCGPAFDAAHPYPTTARRLLRASRIGETRAETTGHEQTRARAQGARTSREHRGSRMPTNSPRGRLRSWRPRAVRVPWMKMSVARVTLALVGGAALAVGAAACSSGDASPSVDPDFHHAERVPDPPPRYKRVETDAGIPMPMPSDDEDPTLHIRCGGHQPYVCPLDDGTFRCSDHPCVPDCDRVGCLGGDVCMSCDGGFRCVAPDSSC